MEIKINESKVLEFNTIIEGGSADDLSGKIRITINDIEYGFPIELNDEKIKVRIPPLKDYIKEKHLRKSKKAHVRLDIISENKIFTPWEDVIELKIPLEVKAEMADIKGFLDEADEIIKISKVVEVKEEDESNKIKAAKKFMKESRDEKIKSRFSVMLKGDEYNVCN